jgi:diaminopimelate epimerase
MSIYSGAGNNFVIINNLDKHIPEHEEKDNTIELCSTQYPEMDGVIFVDNPLNPSASIRMSFYNPDGSYGAMCGNGARCISQFTIDNGILTDKKFTLEAVGKLYGVEILGDNIVRINFPPPIEYKLNLKTKIENDSYFNLHYINVGSDHIVLFTDDLINMKLLETDDLGTVNVYGWGGVLRYHKDFEPRGANVNFVLPISENRIRVRTYERGVERETLACGTGIISSAIISGLLGKTEPPINVLSQFGEWLTVDFRISDDKLENISLTGSARKIG